MERTFPIIDVAPTGAGIGYPDGIRTFVPGALPGDVVACDWTPPEKGRQSQVIDHFEFVERAAVRICAARPPAEAAPWGRSSTASSAASRRSSSKTPAGPPAAKTGPNS